MTRYRVKRMIIQESALSVPRKGFLAKIGKFERYFNIGEEEKVSEWAHMMWDRSGAYPVERNSPCRVYVITVGGYNILYAIYKPIERMVI